MFVYRFAPVLYTFVYTCVRLQGNCIRTYTKKQTRRRKVFYGLICGDVKIAKINTELLTLNIQAIDWAGPRARHSFVPESSSASSMGKTILPRSRYARRAPHESRNAAASRCFAASPAFPRYFDPATSLRPTTSFF